jgi:hypothetical protein
VAASSAAGEQATVATARPATAIRAEIFFMVHSPNWAGVGPIRLLERKRSVSCRFTLRITARMWQRLAE